VNVNYIMGRLLRPASARRPRSHLRSGSPACPRPGAGVPADV